MIFCQTKKAYLLSHRLHSSGVLYLHMCPPSYVSSVSTDSGLKIHTSCTATTDSLCEPLDGFYCVHRIDNHCAEAQKHTQCQPGQYIKHRGEFSNADLKI